MLGLIDVLRPLFGGFRVTTLPLTMTTTRRRTRSKSDEPGVPQREQHRQRQHRQQQHRQQHQHQRQQQQHNINSSRNSTSASMWASSYADSMLGYYIFMHTTHIHKCCIRSREKHQRRSLASSCFDHIVMEKLCGMLRPRLNECWWSYL